jgi:phage shock protein C
MSNSNFSRLRTRITLDSKEGWIAGVCAGLANYLATDPAFVRVTVVISALFFPKLTIAAYLVAWLVLDDDKKLRSR